MQLATSAYLELLQHFNQLSSEYGRHTQDIRLPIEKKLESCLGKIDILQGVTISSSRHVQRGPDENREGKNVIIVGLDESLDTTKVVEEVLNTISAPETISIMKTARLGSLNEGRAKPVKVELSLETKKKLLPDSQIEWSNATEHRSNTRNLQLYTTLATKKAAGENVAIKYRNSYDTK
ncbi:hypothetical protein JTB14_015054 [Gonioctena quinquepunctata]|nr:hypothetical protein JTB14_015054 [Gonioctena quinquepunctata]